MWRSLPFFAATLALQLAVLAQIVERLPPRGTIVRWAAAGCAQISGSATLIALGFLAASIYPAKFRFITPEPELLAYAEGLDEDAAMRAAAGGSDGTGRSIC